LKNWVKDIKENPSMEIDYEIKQEGYSSMNEPEKS